MLFTPEAVYCSGKLPAVCVIPRDTEYYTYKPADSPTQFNYCLPCWKKIKGATVTLPRDEANPAAGAHVVPKDAFKDERNSHLEPEPFVACTECGRRNHQVCVLWHPDCGRDFVCEACRKGKKEKPSPYTAKSKSVSSLRRERSGPPCGGDEAVTPPALGCANGLVVWAQNCHRQNCLASWRLE